MCLRVEHPFIQREFLLPNDNVFNTSEIIDIVNAEVVSAAVIVVVVVEDEVEVLESLGEKEGRLFVEIILPTSGGSLAINVTKGGKTGADRSMGLSERGKGHLRQNSTKQGEPKFLHQLTQQRKVKRYFLLLLFF